MDKSGREDDRADLARAPERRERTLAIDMSEQERPDGDSCGVHLPEWSRERCLAGDADTEEARDEEAEHARPADMRVK